MHYAPPILRALQAGGCSKPGLAERSDFYDQRRRVLHINNVEQGGVSEARRLYSLIVCCSASAPASVFLQLFDLWSGNPTVDTALKMPLGLIRAGETLPYRLDGMSFSQGICLAESSTEDYYTNTGSDDLCVSAWYGMRPDS